MSDKNLGQILREMPKQEAARIISQLTDEEATEILYDWDLWKRPNQHYDLNWPEQFCMALCGRG